MSSRTDDLLRQNSSDAHDSIHADREWVGHNPPPNASRLAIDPFSQTSIHNAVAADRVVCETAKLVWLDQYSMWASANYDTVKSVLDDPVNFSSAKRPFSHDEFPLPAILVTDDAPTHTPLRRAVGRILTPNLVRARSHLFREVAAATRDRVCELQSFDAVTDLAIPYILHVFGDVMGLSRDGRHHLVPFGNAVLNSFGPANESFERSIALVEDAEQWVLEQCTTGAFTADSVGAIIFEGARQGEYSEELAGMLVLNLVSAGVDTTVALISNMFHAFVTHPGQWQTLRQNKKLAGGAFEEAHRWYSPSRFLGRVAHNDVMVGETLIRAGESILLFVGATGRDPAKWESPENFDITRPTGRHLSLGFGIHACLGQMLARAEVTTLFEALSEKVRAFEASGEATVLDSSAVQSFSRFPVRLC